MSAPLLFALLTGGVHAESPAVPKRQIPPSVLVELQLLENDFELALAADCDAQRCYSKGCAYVDHAVADRPRSRSLPGLGEGTAPDASESQEYLTQARCSFAHEVALESGDVQALVRRLQAKLSAGWTVVSVDADVLQPLPAYLREAPEPEVEEEVEVEELVEEPEPEPEPWTAAVAGRELWNSLLPHFFWMIGLGLVTLAGTLLIWAWRRVGTVSAEEQLLLAELGGGASPGAGEADGAGGQDGPGGSGGAQSAFVAEQQAAWTSRLEGAGAARGDVELEALTRELLRSGDLPLLAKAVLRFPDHLPGAFPKGGELAAEKLALADYLERVDADALPADDEFFEALNRHSLSATLRAQSDADLVRSLGEDFGASGLVQLMGGLPARVSALVFALAPAVEQHEMVRLLTARQVGGLSAELLRSNRMDPREMAFLFQVLRAARGEGDMPDVGALGKVSDRGTTFDAAGALSVLLARLTAPQRAALFGQAIERFQGNLPAWTRRIFVADMLFSLSAEACADLLLAVDVERVAAWLSLMDAGTRVRILSAVPASLQLSVQGASVFPSRAQQVGLAERGRQELAGGFQRQLARSGLSFEDVVSAQESGWD